MILWHQLQTKQQVFGHRKRTRQYFITVWNNTRRLVSHSCPFLRNCAQQVEWWNTSDLLSKHLIGSASRVWTDECVAFELVGIQKVVQNSEILSDASSVEAVRWWVQVGF